MKIKSALFALVVLILAAGCTGQAAVATATPSNTPLPTVDVIATGQVLLEATQAANEEAHQATQAAFATIQADAALQATDAFATVEAANTLNTAIAATYSVVNANLRDGFATVEAAGTLNAAIAGTQISGQAALADGFATVEAASTANAAEALNLALTAQAGPIIVTATLAPTSTITATPTEAEVANVILREVDAPDLNLSLRVPEGMPGPQSLEPNTVLFGTDAGVAPRAIIISRLTADDLRSSSGQSFVEGTDGDPVAVLQAALDDTITAMSNELTILQAPTWLDNGLAPAAVARVQPAGTESEIAYVVVYLAQLVYHAPEEWLTMVFLGSTEELDQWIVPVVNSIRPVVETAPTRQPIPTTAPATEEEAIPATEEAEVAPTTPPIPTTEEDDTAEAARVALGVDFIVPEGWNVTSSQSPQMARPSVSLLPAASLNSDTFIGIVRLSYAEIGDLVEGAPIDGTDAQSILSALVDYLKSDGTPYTGGRVNDLAIGDLIGTWTQLRTDEDTYRLYLFALGEADWLLIGAQAPSADFTTFSQNELRDVLASLALREEPGGVALGLDFDLPDGWITSVQDTGDLTLPTAGTVRLSPQGVNPEQRMVILSRGSAADFAGLALPADETDPAAALAPIADYLRTLGEFSGGRVEPFQLDMLPGAFTSLRNDEASLRTYLFRLGDDDWLLIIAGANRDAFNDFNRNELRTILANLQPAAGTAVQTVTPIGPIEEVVVTHVSDGDTIYVMYHGVEESVRIIGVDTQEAHHPNSGAEWLGYAATHFVEQYITAGSTVWLESDIEDRDDYDRLLRYVWTKDEDGNWRMLEADLIRSGMAHVRTYDEDRYVPYFHALEREAMAEGLGVWGTPPTPPVDSLAVDQQTVWAINPDGDVIPMLFDAAALGNVPDPVAYWPNHVQAVVEDVYYVYPEDIDPVTGEPVSADKVGYWYWLEINDFRGWVPEAWILTEEPEWTYPAPDTDIINYAEPFVLGDTPLEVVTEAGGTEVTGTLEPGSRVPVDGLGIDPATGDWWLRVDTQGVDGWVPLTRLSRMRPAG